MANGEELSIVELKKMSEELEIIKTDLEKFAVDQSIDFSYNIKGWPNILFRWNNNNELQCTVQLYMNDDKKTFTLWVAVYKDISLGRRILTNFMNKNITVPFNQQWLTNEIQKAISFCDSVGFEDLPESE